MMKKSTKILMALAALVGTVLQSDSVQQYLGALIAPLAAAHPKFAAALAAISVILALVHNPNSKPNS